MKIDSGIYMFRNLDNNKVYIGQSKYLHTRYREHKSELANGIHHNSYLQRAVQAHGFDRFEYKILERCPVEMLDEREAYYIDYYDARNRDCGYNIREAGNESDMPSETVEKIRMANRGKNSKLTVAEVEEIKIARLNGKRCYELADEYGITIAAVNKITMCRNWVYVREDLNDKLLALASEENKKREDEVRILYEQGLRPHQIYRESGIDERVVKRILENELSTEKERDHKIKEDFMKNLPVSVIMEKHSVTYSQYKRITKGMKEKRDKLLYKEIVKRKQQGEKVKDIAEALGVHRGTINDITKRFENNM